MANIKTGKRPLDAETTQPEEVDAVPETLAGSKKLRTLESLAAPLTNEVQTMIKGKPALKAHADLASTVLINVKRVLGLLRADEPSADNTRTALRLLQEVCNMAQNHIEFLQVWQAHGPQTARKWAELVGMASSPAMFDDPAKQSALEQALEACKSSKGTSTSNPEQHQQQGWGGLIKIWCNG